MRRCYGVLATFTAAAMSSASLFLAGCGGETGGGTPGGGTSGSLQIVGSTTPTAVAQAQNSAAPVDPAIVAADNAFGLNLLNVLLPSSGGANVAISPLSVSLSMQILLNGAAGSTQQAMAQTLELGALSTSAMNSDNAALQASLLEPDFDVQLTIANSLWIGSTVTSSFKQTDEMYYGAAVGDLGGAPANVNAWVDSETHGLIPSLLQQGQYTGAIIANVLYFKGAWTTPFESSVTTSAPFSLNGGGQTTVQLMNETANLDFTSGSLHGSTFQAVRIPYGEGRLSMLVILPGATNAIVDFVSAMTAADLTGLSADLSQYQVTLSLPRFTATYENSLIPALNSLGMGAAFDPSADFSALAPGFVLNVLEHKTVIEVDETGTAAAAGTGAGMITTVPPPATMTIDHPFFYIIQDGQTGALLFIGVMMNPNAM